MRSDIEANSKNSTKEKGELARTLCRHVHRYSVSIRSRYKAILRSFAASHDFQENLQKFPRKAPEFWSEWPLLIHTVRPSLYRECLSLFEVHMASWFHWLFYPSYYHLQYKRSLLASWNAAKDAAFLAMTLQGTGILISQRMLYVFGSFWFACLPSVSSTNSRQFFNHISLYCFSMKAWESRMLWKQRRNLFLALTSNYVQIVCRWLGLSQAAQLLLCDRCLHIYVITPMSHAWTLFRTPKAGGLEGLVLNTLTRPQGSHVANWVV